MRVSRRPQNYPLRAKERVGQGCLALDPELFVGGEGACRPGLVASTPELSVRGKGACWLGLVAYVGVARAPSVDRLPKGDALSSPELTVGADGDAMDWNTPQSVTYRRCRE